MKIRAFRESDLEKIDKIYRKHHQDHFSLPERKLVLTDAIIEDKDEVIGYGIVRFFAEAIAVLDLDKPVMNRLVALEMLLTEAFRACETTEIEQLHVYVQDEGMKRILMKRFDFKIATGTALVREF